MNLLRLSTIIMAALSMGLALSHLLQMPPRMGFDAGTWLTTQRVFPLYATVGAIFEIGAVLLAGIYAFIDRAGPGLGWALTGGICFAVAFFIWIVLVAPANAEIAKWTTTRVPADWTSWRAQWELSHALRALLMIVGFVAIVRSVIMEISAR